MSFLNLNINEMINSLSGIIFIKDCHFKYITANDAFLNLCNVPSREDVVGITDQDLITRAYSHFYRKCDQQVLASSKAISVIEPLYKNDQIFVMRTTKKPLYNNENNLIGVIAQAFIIKTHSDSSEFMDGANILPHLTKRQSDCLHYYSKGMSLKQISEILNISPRTVANYIENIKNKLNCFSRSDLVKAALQLGMFANDEDN